MGSLIKKPTPKQGALILTGLLGYQGYETSEVLLEEAQDQVEQEDYRAAGVSGHGEAQAAFVADAFVLQKENSGRKNCGCQLLAEHLLGAT